MRWLAPLVLLVGCADDGPRCRLCPEGVVESFAPGDEALDTLPLDAVPPTLADSGFYSLDKREYEPRWKLWSDGAEKQRWIYLPEGAQIDTTKPDYWSFPVGTRLWKQFTLNGAVVETRYAAKYGPADADWLFVAFAGDGTAAPDGATDVDGTPHDIPSRETCLGCHANVRSRVLGFSLFQLDYDAPAPLLDLADATAAGWFTTTTPHIPVPGNAAEVATLGYFHANCGHCHNSQSPLINRPMFRLESDHMASLAGTRTYQSTVNVQGTPYGGASIVAKPGDPDHSIIYTRMHSADPKKHMPALGSEVADSAAINQIRAWITNL